MTLPVGPGITFESSAERFILQDGFKARVLVDGPGEVDIFFPNQAVDGEPLATVDDVVAALQRAPGCHPPRSSRRGASPGWTRRRSLSRAPPGRTNRATPPPVLTDSSDDEAGWIPFRDGFLWVAETPDGLLVVVVTAECFEPEGMEPARSLATEVLNSITVGG